MKRTAAFVLILTILLGAIHTAGFAAGDAAEAQYEKGMSYFVNKDYDSAFSYFQISGEVRGYAPSQNMLGVCYRDGLGTEQDLSEAEKHFTLAAGQGYAPAQENLAALQEKPGKAEQEIIETKALKTGDSFIFGVYEQDNNLQNGKEPIEWMVLDVQDGKALLISKYGLDCKAYNYSGGTNIWETCELRVWINETFFHDAFNAEEQERILTIKVKADSNPVFNTDPGNDTLDKVFLLSIPEVNQYFASDSSRECLPTAYAQAQGCYVNQSNGNCWWWLRSPGLTPYFTTLIHADGSVDYGGLNTARHNDVIRPALWISPDEDL